MKWTQTPYFSQHLVGHFIYEEARVRLTIRQSRMGSHSSHVVDIPLDHLQEFKVG